MGGPTIELASGQQLCRTASMTMGYRVCVHWPGKEVKRPRTDEMTPEEPYLAFRI